MKPFDMLITGNEIPSWFAPQKSSFFAEIPYLHRYPPIEWVGYAVEEVPDEYDWEYDWSDEAWRISRNLPPMEPKQPHLYILFLPHSLSEEFLDRSKSHGFGLMSRCRCDSLRTVQAGCRLVCKEDVQDLYGNYYI
ncbi:hypothetical protein PIB30_023629 [Stylosanthes scabra]|uniref:Uncharacterized protein n=1 Tax=Stylosanthes scabra TaxID=79078 RepID=A0ABU6Q9Z5_9FABA|nr:hypothetical protein [Stylosanthes scabra]